ncbi:hypothetical protein [uncultured Clostridium sp.]|uniref:hypothetical protein n=1 Tax=uncultured Clostridium sp. TaxID=59620 RepID=UPI0028E35E36|nr:hypothetical protein [uncultured Clostridium sp.]
MDINNLSTKAKDTIMFGIFHTISEKLDQAETKEDIKLLEELINWYNENILLSGADLENKLLIKKAKLNIK